jgi:hypothetical protein
MPGGLQQQLIEFKQMPAGQQQQPIEFKKIPVHHLLHVTFKFKTQQVSIYQFT